MDDIVDRLRKLYNDLVLDHRSLTPPSIKEIDCLEDIIIDLRILEDEKE